MTTDQPRLAKSRLLVAQAFERDRAAASPPDPHETATWLLEQLENQLGWTPPRDLTETVPLAGAGADPDHRAACMETIRATFAARRAQSPTSNAGQNNH